MRKFAAVAASAVAVFAAAVTFAAEPVEAGAGDNPTPAMGTEAAEVAPTDVADVALPGSTRVAANPKNPKYLVAAASGACLAYRSGNGGRTWSRPVALPLGVGNSNECYDATTAYAPDGKSVYAAYAVPDASELGRNILVSRSDDNGATWRTLAVALDGVNNAIDYSGPLSVGTSVRTADGDWLYVIAFAETGLGPCERFHFARSADRGASWSPPQTIAGACPGDQGDTIGDATVAGGVGGDVLVAWTYYASAEPVLGTVNVKRSQNHGATFGSRVVAGADVVLGPDWYDQLDVKVGNQGTAHIVYKRQAPSPGDRGDIGYIWSARPYRTWSAPVTLNDDAVPNTQSAPLLATQTCGSATLLQVVWGDARNQSWDMDVFYTRKIAQVGSAWSKNLEMSDWPGGSPSGVAMSQGGAFAAWDGYGSRILSGVTCP